jgi:hypothetical protein
VVTHREASEMVGSSVFTCSGINEDSGLQRAMRPAPCWAVPTLRSRLHNGYHSNCAVLH